MNVWQDDYDRGYLYECEFLDEEEKAKLPRDQLHQPTRVIPIHNTNDKPITCIRFGLVLALYMYTNFFKYKILTGTYFWAWALSMTLSFEYV